MIFQSYVFAPVNFMEGIQTTLVDRFELNSGYLKTDTLKDHEDIIPASPRAANGRRPLAAPASVASVGAALCLKIRLFCQVNSWIAILRQHKILSGTYNF